MSHRRGAPHAQGAHAARPRGDLPDRRQRPRRCCSCTGSPTRRRRGSASRSRSSEHFTLIAPDLLGHGESATPRGDYSLGAHASGVRDVLTALGHDRVTVVGHSLGGGIAMQFAYQFPERCERLVLVSSGGLGREVHLLLRAAALPGADWVLPLLTSRGLLGVGRSVGGAAAAGAARARRGPRGARAGVRVARQRRLAPGVPAHRPRGDRAERPAGQRAGPARPRGRCSRR